jgi:hypothetical protein
VAGSDDQSEAGRDRRSDGLQRMMRFVDIDSVEAARDDLLDIVDLWCATR